MDYEKNIQKFFDKQSQKIVKKFKEYKAASRPFSYAVDKITSSLSEDRENSIIHLNLDLFRNAVYDFNHYEDKYKKGVSISLIIEDEILAEYRQNITSKPIKGLDKIELSHYSFEELIDDLILYDSLGKIIGRLKNNSALFDLIYKSNKFEHFTLMSFTGHVVNNACYQKLFKEVYPDQRLPIAIEEQGDLGNRIYRIETDLKKSGSDIKLLHSHKNTKPKFEIDEQALILNLCISDGNIIPVSEKCKLLILVGEIEEDSIFKQSSSVNLFYHKVQTGILRKGSSKTMRFLIDLVLKKIEGFDLSITEQTLRKHRAGLK